MRVSRIAGKKVEIQSHSLEEIARFAAINASEEIAGRVVVEDAGLFIKVLNGFPGPFSSFVYETIGSAGLLKLLEGAHSREAEFRSAVAIAEAGKILATFEDFSRGKIALSASGKLGFGFDPIFIPNRRSETFGDMDIDVKNRLSHRARAFRALGRWLLSDMKEPVIQKVSP